jgi:hypothetical protein
MMEEFLNQDDLDLIRQSAKDLSRNALYAAELLIRNLISSNYDPSTGQATYSWEEYFVKAVAGDHTMHDVERSGGRLAIGDKFFSFHPDVVKQLLTTHDKLLVKLTSKGGVTLTNGSSAVAGTGAEFRADGVAKGDTIKVGSIYAIVGSVIDEDNITLSSNWTEQTVTEAEYVIYRPYTILSVKNDILGALVVVSARRSGV